MDENNFFRQMTLRICGSLDIETALRRCFDYLSEFFPLDGMSLHLYEQDIGSVQTLVETTATESRRVNTLTPMTPLVRAGLENPNIPNVRIVNRSANDPVNRQLAISFNLPNTSILLMRLVIENQRLGTLVLMAEGFDRFTEEHAHLMSLLNEAFAIALSNTLQHQEVLRLKDSLADENRYLRKDLLNLPGDQIIGADFGLKQVMAMIRVVAPQESPVLLLGETGVGKGVMASVIHHLSARNTGPFITVNSGAIPDTLIDSELFGHEKGAFTGAIESKRGRFERAQDGTLFLDEIGELPTQAQVRMLRVLQEKTIERVGGTRSIPVNIRIIAATHRNLEGMIKAGQFREDLWFRINVFPIRIPPLRERREDIPSLVNRFITVKTRQLKLPEPPQLAPGAIDLLMRYSWPGNVRQLENAVEREMILNRTGPLAFQSLGLNGQGEAGTSFPKGGGNVVGLDQMTAEYIRRVLRTTNGVLHGPAGAAALLKVHPSTLRSKMKKLGIPYGRKGIHGAPPEDTKE